MNFKALIQESDIRLFAAADLLLPALPADGNRLLQDITRRFSSDYARRHSFAETILPNIAPHQVAGQIDARQLDGLNDFDQELRAAFVDEVLVQDEEGVRLDERAILECFNAGLAVWR